MVPGLAVFNLELKEKEFRKISNLVYRHCGINLHEGKKELVRARLAKRLRLGKFRTFSEYMKHVLNDSTGYEFSLLIDSLSTNLTSFFRGGEHFGFLAKEFLPALLERKRKTDSSRIRAWSAGCSSGEEAYSIAIALLDALEGQGQWDAKVLATDISTHMLDIAKKGIYEKQRVTTVPALQCHKYLVPLNVDGQKCFKAGLKLRETVVLEYLNLMDDWPIRGPLDFIFCRNVMIYFDKPTQQRLVKRFWDLLDSGGLLFTGHSESLTGIEHDFKYIRPTIYVKQ